MEDLPEEAQFIPDYEEDFDLPEQQDRKDNCTCAGLGSSPWVPAHSEGVQQSTVVSETSNKTVAQPAGRQCPLCGERVKKMRRHVERRHLPWWFHPEEICWTCRSYEDTACFLRARHTEKGHDTKFTTQRLEQWVGASLKLLEILRSVLGVETHQQMLNMVVKGKYYPTERIDIPLMRSLCWQVVGRVLTQERGLQVYQVNPPNAIEATLHWKVVLLIMCTASIEVQHVVAEMDCVYSPQEIWLPLTDAHTRLDVLMKRLRANTIEELREQQHKIRPVYDTIFIVSLNFQSSLGKFNMLCCNQHISFTVGLHPHEVSAQQPSDSLWHTMVEMIMNPKCIAVGEVGIDYQCHPHMIERKNQHQYLRRIVSLARELKKPVVIHCRDNDSDPGQARIDCLRILQSELPVDHPLYVHHFSDNLEGLQEWRLAFPKSWFGFGRRILREDCTEILRNLDLQQILLESDSPYQLASPWEIPKVADRVADIRGLPTALLMEMCLRNIQQFMGTKT